MLVMLVTSRVNSQVCDKAAPLISSKATKLGNLKISFVLSPTPFQTWM